VDAVSGPFDVVAAGDRTRWSVIVVEDAERVDGLLRDIQRHGVAIDDEALATSGPLYLARTLHLGRFTHFSRVAPGLRRDHAVRHGQDCIVLEPDVTPC